MTVSNSVYAHILAELFQNPVSEEKWQNQLDLALFVRELKKEGAEIIRENGMLFWKNKLGFGKHSLSVRTSVPIFFSESCSSTNDLAKQGSFRPHHHGILLPENRLQVEVVWDVHGKVILKKFDLFCRMYPNGINERCSSMQFGLDG